MAGLAARPNIRIEIHNNLAENANNESMDVDQEEEDGEESPEEGEISEKIDEDIVLSEAPIEARQWNPDRGFTTGVDIFAPNEQGKREERAQRFGLKDDEIKRFTEDDLLQLYTSLGIASASDNEVRFEAIHMRGTEEMSTDDVFNCFAKYGPAHVEWISDDSCNVVWLDRISCARALHYESQPIKGVPVEGTCNPFNAKEVADETQSGRSILLIDAGEQRQVELEKEETTDVSTISVADITIPIPPGYWRLGTQHPKAKFLLVRFALLADQKPFRAERFSAYYKKYGNPNYGGMVGLISESMKRKFRGIFGRNKAIDNRNPWGDLAETWNDNVANPQEVEPVAVIVEDVVEEVRRVDGPEILKRLGRKRTSDPIIEVKEEEEEEDGAVGLKEKKSKVPRMRMYADEEEAKIKRKRQLMSLKQVQMRPMAADIEEQMVKETHTRDLRKLITAVPRKPPRQLPSPRREIEITTRHRYDEEMPRFRSDVEEAASVVRPPVAVNERKMRARKLRGQSPPPRPATNRIAQAGKFRSDDYPERALRASHANKKMHRDEVGAQKTKSKVTVVVRAQKKPTVASTVWSRIDDKRARVADKEARAWNRSSSESSESSSGSSTDSSSSSSDTESSDEEEVEKVLVPQKKVPVIQRPGFSSGNPSSKTPASSNGKSPLRIEISNDHFKEE